MTERIFFQDIVTKIKAINHMEDGGGLLTFLGGSALFGGAVLAAAFVAFSPVTHPGAVEKTVEATTPTRSYPCTGGTLEQGKDGQYTARLPVKVLAPQPH